MSDFTTMPIDQLSERCTSLAQPLSMEGEIAWQELLRRALLEHSDAAWDALVLLLWPAVLFWIYAQRPEIAPAVAEALVQRVIRQFQEAYRGTDSSDEHTSVAIVKQLLYTQIVAGLS
ncbi:MAG: hypothetical protein R2932_33250 [Caldilineaceae bacterium]